MVRHVSFVTPSEGTMENDRITPAHGMASSTSLESLCSLRGEGSNQGRLTDEINQANCSHKKGGLVSPRDLTVLHQGGDSDKHSIIRHRMIDGSMWIRCTRCRKSWFPPVKINYYFNDKGKRVAPKDGVFSLAKYQAAEVEYATALKMKTSGTPSGSVVCRFLKWELDKDGVGQWVDGTEAYRESVANTNLR